MSLVDLATAGAGIACCWCCFGQRSTPSDSDQHRRDQHQKSISTTQQLQKEVGRAEQDLRAEAAQFSEHSEATVADGSPAALLEAQLAFREKSCDGLKVKELQQLIAGRGARPREDITGPKLRIALVQQAKALPPAAIAGRAAADARPVPAWLGRTELLLGEGAMGKLADARVLVVGMGGVGSWAAEFLVRGGVGHITVVDDDAVDPTNRNRQLVALRSTEGKAKAVAMAARLLDINPELDVQPVQLFVSEKGAEVDAFISAGMGQGRPFDYVIDAIDSLQPKVELIRSSLKHRIPIVSSMGAGGRLDPAAVVSCDLSQLQWDRETIRATKKGASKNTASKGVVVAHEKLGTFVRKKLAKDYNIVGGVTVITSSEMPRKAFALTSSKSKNKASYYGTWSCLPASFGMHAASIVLNGLVAVSKPTKADRKLRRDAEVAAAKAMPIKMDHAKQKDY